MNPTFSDNSQIGLVAAFSELVHTDFKGEINALCWYRNLEGDFAAIVDQLQLKKNITEVSPQDLMALQLTKKGSIARGIILNDWQLLTNFGASPSINTNYVYNLV